MFEVVLALCLDGQSQQCRDVLIPGYEATTQEYCEENLARAPIDGAFCTVAPEPLEMSQTSPGVFVHRGAIEEPNSENRGDVSNQAFVIGTKSVAVIDTGAAAWIGESLWRAVRAQTDLPVSHVILTHMHPDHILGASVFERAGAEIVGHAALPRAIADRRENYLQSLERLIGMPDFLGTDTPNLSMLVEEVQEIDLGERVLRLQAWPSAHTGSDLTVLDVQSQTFFAGDLVFHEHTPALDGKLRGWQTVLGQMSQMSHLHLVPGHGGPVLDWPEGLGDMQRYLGVLASDTADAIAKGERLGAAVQHIAQKEAPQWQLFDAYNPRNATVAFTELEWE